MERIQTLLPTIWDKKKHKTLPVLKTSYNENGFEEGYTASYEKGAIHLDAESPSAAAYGSYNILAGVRSDHLGEHLGDNKPRYALRPLWICGTQQHRLSDNVTIALPNFFAAEENPEENKKLHTFCHRTIQCGYNAVILGGSETPKERRHQEDKNFVDTIAVIRSYGIKVIVKADITLEEQCPCNAHYRDAVEKEINSLSCLLNDVDYIMWESGFCNKNFYGDAENATVYDLISNEVATIENALQGRSGLIYYLPYHENHNPSWQSSWLENLCNDASNGTIVAFSAVSGKAHESYRQEHPLWQALRQNDDIDITPTLMPIVNVGKTSYGEGLWPDLTLSAIERYIGTRYHHACIGATVMTRHLPDNDGILAASLWIAGQRMWRDITACDLADTWFRGYRPEIPYQHHKEMLNDVEDIIIALYRLYHNDNDDKEGCRIKAQEILARISVLQKEYGMNYDDDTVTTLGDYLRYFVRDARKMILHIITTNGITIAGVLDGDDLTESFWANVEGATSRGGNLGGKMTSHFLTTPQKGEPGSRQEMIYNENV
ncbi:MAG: hypothetical protein HN411_04885 [Waddliaceae bacterium]|nr:hypothetical protein [Waddliaceae bacterium]MBT3579064.1 hypothetical protein [Waddliaceae bacterium]MBT4444774.1 hypothetical protein [Waddliaceae bacterium]MBT6928043.1 hypothetical protein [Waddliaceae bacterium]